LFRRKVDKLNSKLRLVKEGMKKSVLAKKIPFEKSQLSYVNEFTVKFFHEFSHNCM